LVIHSCIELRRLARSVRPQRDSVSLKRAPVWRHSSMMARAASASRPASDESSSNSALRSSEMWAHATEPSWK